MMDGMGWDGWMDNHYHRQHHHHHRQQHHHPHHQHHHKHYHHHQVTKMKLAN